MTIEAIRSWFEAGPHIAVCVGLLLLAFIGALACSGQNVGAGR
jgi:hypothetical protein